MSNSKQQQEQIIELDEKIAEGFILTAIINHSSSEFVLDFVSIMPGIPKAKVKSNCLDTATCQRLLKAIGENIHRFEQAHGIKDTEQPQFH
jgi:hypothetical protein